MCYNRSYRRKYNYGEYIMSAVDFITANWEWFLLAFMICEKLVKLSPTQADDIVLDVVWGNIKKLVGKG